MIYKCTQCDTRLRESDLKDDEVDEQQQVCPLCDGDVFEVLRDD